LAKKNIDFPVILIAGKQNAKNPWLYRFVESPLTTFPLNFSFTKEIFIIAEKALGKKVLDTAKK